MNDTPNSICPNCFKTSGQKKCLICGFDQNNYLEEAQHLPLFSIIGEQYTLGRVLASEDLAITYVAQRKGEKERFVIKEYYPENLAGRSRNSSYIKPKNSAEKKQGFDFYYKSFIEEARLLENCQKYPAIPGIVRYTDLIEQNNTLYLVIEYLDGCTLFDLWLNQQKLSEKQICLWLRPLIDTLEKLHQRNIYHQKISLNNIFLRGGAKQLDAPVLMNFGLSEHSMRESLIQFPLINFDYLKYQAPEQRLDNPETEIDARTDLYALGAVLFHCLNGKEIPSIEIRRMGSALVFNNENIHPALKKAIEGCLALSKKNRPKNIAALKKLLSPFLLPPKDKLTSTPLTNEKRQRDLALWQQAKKADTIHAYQNYLKYCELGEQKEIAAEAIKRLKLEARLAALENKNPIKPEVRIVERLSLSKSQDKLKSGQLAPVMILIPAGTFLMGSAETEKDRFENETQHEVEIEKPFYIGQYPITFAEYDLYCEQKNIKKVDDSGWGRENRPVTHVSWFDARDYCEWLSEQTGKNYCLPSETEWEYACRAGTQTPYYFGAETKQLKNYAWYRKNAGGKTHPVGLKKPNIWGIYDMHGNIWEWTASEYNEDNTQKVPILKNESPYHPVVRGGSWDYIPWWLRSAYREGWEAAYRNSDLGFRIMKTC